jgi:hypothetical protein
VHVTVKPEDTIAELLCRVEKESGKCGTLRSVRGELCLKETVQASGLSDKDTVYLEIEDVFDKEKLILIAVRGRLGIQHANWGNLEECTEPKQLAECVGVDVSADGRVTTLDLSCFGLKGEEVGQCQ